MTTSSTDCRQGKHEAIFDFHPVTGASFEVFYADRTLDSFGWSGAGWYWHFRRRGFAPTGPVRGPFATSYRGYRDALYPTLGSRQRAFLELGLQ
jgi:hypothetical protein